MTLEELFVREYDFQKGKNAALTQELAAMDMQLQRLKETLEVYMEDLNFFKGLFELNEAESMPGRKFIDIKHSTWDDSKDYDRLYDLCGFNEGDEEE